MRCTTFALSLALSSLALSAPSAQEQIDRDINWKIRREATDNSRILRTLHFLTDVYGPRLTGSPNLKAAQDWVVTETTAWGLKNARLEPWSFGHPGWVKQPTKEVLTTFFDDNRARVRGKIAMVGAATQVRVTI